MRGGPSAQGNPLRVRVTISEAELGGAPAPDREAVGELGLSAGEEPALPADQPRLVAARDYSALAGGRPGDRAQGPLLVPRLVSRGAPAACGALRAAVRDGLRAVDAARAAVGGELTAEATQTLTRQSRTRSQALERALAEARAAPPARQFGQSAALFPS